MTDIVVRPAGPLLRGTDRDATIRPMPGGAGANLAAWLGYLGLAVTLLARVGAADAVAQEAALARHGVRPLLARDGQNPSGCLIALIDPDGERSFLTDRGANAALCRADLPDAALDGAAWLHLSGYPLFLDGPRAAALDYAAAARRRGIPVSVDAASAGFLAQGDPARFLDWTAGAEVLFANADEAALLAPATDAATQLCALAGLYPVVVLKRGAAEAVAWSAEAGTVSAPAPRVHVADTTGAGDAFAAGFIAARLCGTGLGDALAHAVATGAEAVARTGARPP